MRGLSPRRSPTASREEDMVACRGTAGTIAGLDGEGGRLLGLSVGERAGWCP